MTSRRVMFNRLKAALAGLTLLLLPAPALAWNDTPHVIIAHIAYSRLNPTAMARVDAAAGRIEYRGRKYNNISIATYMDDLRGDPFYDYLSPLHFISLRDDDDLEKLAKPGGAAERGNILTQLNKTIADLRAGKEAEVGEGEALLIAYLIHLVGDAHQPLHCADLVSKEHPDGDASGNFFFIQGEARSLHSFWDRAGNLFGPGAVQFPLDSTGYDQIRNFSFDLLKAYQPKEKDVEKFAKPEDWIKESFEIADDEVYEDVREDAPLSDDYQNKVKRLSGERLVLAAYRLAALLNDIYPARAEPVTPTGQQPKRQEQSRPEPQPPTQQPTPQQRPTPPQ